MQSKDEHGNWRINWIPAVVLAIFHIGAVAALFFFTWTNLFLMLGLYWFTISFGIGVCYHRLLTHRSYVVPKWLEYTLAVIATLALEGGPISWVATHRMHHQYSDKDGDPHSPMDGIWWAHLWWMMTGAPSHNQTTVLAKYVPDLAKDRFYNWLSTWHWIPLAMLTAGLWVAFGFKTVLWVLCLRIVIGLHATWFVNSASHRWGGRRFQTKDDSRNNWWVALLSFGEGWHNNHHAHPTSAKHGMAWYEIDFNWMAIWMLKTLGLAKKVRVAKLEPEMAAAGR